MKVCAWYLYPNGIKTKTKISSNNHTLLVLKMWNPHYRYMNGITKRWYHSNNTRLYTIQINHDNHNFTRVLLTFKVWIWQIVGRGHVIYRSWKPSTLTFNPVPCLTQSVGFWLHSVEWQCITILQKLKWKIWTIPYCFSTDKFASLECGKTILVWKKEMVPQKKGPVYPIP